VELAEAVDLRITGRCNLSCPFCFGPRHDIGHTHIAEFIELVGRLPDVGVRRVVITGGEPTLVPGLPELLMACRDAGLVTILSTNGTLLSRRHRQILPNLDWVAQFVNPHLLSANSHDTYPDQA
jgi:radical S-adenosyl methionine domain-containing protein 2